MPHIAELDCWYASTEQDARKKGQDVVAKFGRHIRAPVIDLGCGEGAALLGLRDAGHTDLLGVELNEELAGLAEKWGAPVVRSDLRAYIRQPLRAATYLYLDVIEHIPFDLNVEVLNALPSGSRIIIQTPYTESIRGHQFYFNVPSHVAPYSPWVLRRMLTRAGYKVTAEGDSEGTHPDRWTAPLRRWFVRRVLAIPPDLVYGGGNWWVVADKG